MKDRQEGGEGREGRGLGDVRGIRDLRRYARQTNVQLVIGALLLLFIVGEGLIAWIYGPGAAVFGLLCLGAGLAPIVIIVLALWLMEWVVKHANRE